MEPLEKKVVEEQCCRSHPMVLVLKILFVLGSIYSGLTLLWLVPNYCLLLAGNGPYFPLVTVCIGLPNVIFLLVAKVELRDELHLGKDFNWHWQGIFPISATIMNVGKVLLRVAIVNFFLAVIWTLLATRSDEWDRASPNGERIIFAVYVSMQIVIALVVLLYGLGGKFVILSPNAVNFYSNPISFLCNRLQKPNKIIK